jgi:thioredoxin-like negative regulator of GroEL
MAIIAAAIGAVSSMVVGLAGVAEKKKADSVAAGIAEDTNQQNYIIAQQNIAAQKQINQGHDIASIISTISAAGVSGEAQVQAAAQSAQMQETGKVLMVVGFGLTALLATYLIVHKVKQT